jgi:hypothetical protein
MNPGQDKDARAADGAPAQPAAVRPRRRGFLLGAGAAAGVGAAALAVGRNAQPPVEAAAPQDHKPVASRGYHVTDHVRKYYDTAKV